MTVWSSSSILPFAVCMAWFASEIALGRLLHSKGDSASALDRSSLRVLWLTILPSITIGVVLGLSRLGFLAAHAFTVSICGFAFIIVGLIIRWVAILSLRRYFTTDVSIQSGHQLMTSGLYGIVRHPAYSGTLISFAGLGLSFASWLSTVVIFIPITCAFLYRIHVEEKALREHFGESYAAYCRKVKHRLPLIY